ncbi:hypothetical protein CVS40_6878 [Lucilia cuprina]|nr:hypothetical protein CVS40_6878 [Lucilia cuprina]KAI8122211.1 hypothetical protein CVS40_6878 [Lucilia cuprina]
MKRPYGYELAGGCSGVFRRPYSVRSGNSGPTAMELAGVAVGFSVVRYSVRSGNSDDRPTCTLTVSGMLYEVGHHHHILPEVLR